MSIACQPRARSACTVTGCNPYAPAASVEHVGGLLGVSRILYALDLVDERCVGDIALALGATEDSVGYGLRVLRTAGLVATRKQGRVVYYRLSDGFPDPLRQHCLRSLVELSRRVEQQG